MPELSDFLGHILEEITRARIAADMEAVKTARLYAADGNELLKNFAIPRFRLPQIEISAPVVITEVPSGSVETTDPRLLRQAAANDIGVLLSKQEIKISTTQITELIEADEFLSKGRINKESIDSLTLGIANQIKPAADRGANHDKIVSLIREQLTKTFAALPRKPLGITIDPTTANVKNHNQGAGQAGNVVYLKLSITEDSLEIQFKDPSDVSPGDSKIKRLIPE